MDVSCCKNKETHKKGDGKAMLMPPSTPLLKQAMCCVVLCYVLFCCVMLRPIKSNFKGDATESHLGIIIEG